ncbi:response regulator transcription factor [Taibaiella lutea]|uniref:Response regulator transcription factor n=1 Tax=Taibaiella lutea TaxID=2608001 RepID=A0A5M6CIN6_9BACT|nr:response regulator transcription factor [Taibaiella lutea]KAA5534964.1 response regulator transcription factor [Taibaiella lutea]
MNLKIAIVDDNRRNRYSLAEQLRISAGIAVILQAGDGGDYLEQMKVLEPEQYPDVVLMDIEMPGMNGIDTVRNSKTLYPSVKYLMLTVFDDDDKIFEAIRAGANGYLLKDEKPMAIIECIQQLAELDAAPMSPSIARKTLALLSQATLVTSVDKPASVQLLSERELEVLKQMAIGKDYKQIAATLFLSTHTIRKHIANIYEKLHVTSKIQAVNIAQKNNWV